MIKSYPIGAIIGRFQVHELHDAHRFVIDQVVNNHRKSIIFLGVSKVIGTKNNPLDFDSRKKMIQSEYPNSIILAIPDVNDDFAWVSEIDKRIREVYPIGDVLLYGGRDSSIPYYKKGKGHFDTKELEQFTFVSGTEVRRALSEDVKNSSDFRAGVIYQSYNQYPKVYPSIDVVILNNDETKILLAKMPFENGWRFIGGLAHPSDSSYESTLRRKICEDAGRNINIGDIKFVGTAKIDDWRYSKEEDKIFTILFKAKKLFGTIEPSANVSELKWFDIHYIAKSWFDIDNNVIGPIVNEHKPLIKMFFEKF